MKTAIELLEEVIEELKEMRRQKTVLNEDRRIRCNWCESVFDERHIKVIDDIEYCPVCGETGYLMDVPEEESDPRWETPRSSLGSAQGSRGRLAGRGEVCIICTR
jgi:late competence protein required for DNA uptake (superfamily II DNA/RNA helicase)